MSITDKESNTHRRQTNPSARRMPRAKPVTYPPQNLPVTFGDWRREMVFARDARRQRGVLGRFDRALRAEWRRVVGSPSHTIADFARALIALTAYFDSDGRRI